MQIKDKLQEKFYDVIDSAKEYGSIKSLIFKGIIIFLLVSYFVMVVGQMINPARMLKGTPINYNPFSLFGQLLLNPGWFLFIFLAFGAFLIVFIAMRVYSERMEDGEIDPISKRKFAKNRQLGDAHFATRKEIREFMDITPVEKIKGIPLGKLTRDTSECVSIPEEAKSNDTKVSNGNMLIYGASGAGKTYAFVDPYIYKVIDRGHSFISVDVKGEVYADTYFYALKNNYIIKTFNCDEPEKGNSIHLLKLVGTDQNQADLIANVLVRNSSDPQGKSVPFWEDMLHQLLKACILYITYEYEDQCNNLSNPKSHLSRLNEIESKFENGEFSEEQKEEAIIKENERWKAAIEPIHGYGTIGRMYDFINEGLYEFDDEELIFKPEDRSASVTQLEYVQGKYSQVLEDTRNNHPGLQAWRTFQAYPEQHKGNSLGTMATRLRILQNDNVRKGFGIDDIDITMPGNQKSAIYAVMDPLEPSKRIISAVFFTLMTKTMMDIAKKRKNRRLKVETHVVMDEYFSIGEIPGIEEEVSLCRSYGMNLIFILQGRTQLKNRHPQGYQTVESNCATTVIMGAGTEENTLKYVEQISGTTTVQTDSSAYERSTLAPVELIKDFRANKGMSAQPLITVGEGIRQPRYIITVIISPMNVMRLYKLGRHEMPQYQQIENCPPVNFYNFLEEHEKYKNYFTKNDPMAKYRINMPNTAPDKTPSYSDEFQNGNDSLNQAFSLNRSTRNNQSSDLFMRDQNNVYNNVVNNGNFNDYSSFDNEPLKKDPINDDDSYDKPPYYHNQPDDVESDVSIKQTMLVDDKLNQTIDDQYYDNDLEDDQTDQNEDFQIESADDDMDDMDDFNNTIYEQESFNLPDL